MKKFKLIIPYVVGSFLSFPLVIYHCLFAETSSLKQNFPRNIYSRYFKKKNRYKQKNSAVRQNCGHSQKDIRMLHRGDPAQNS
ncbi:MAG: hypothetical protein J6C85_03820 [Alphaproteobacteria bacterium]|nr:hypothetical protein [Alphaproteobacteria bacterium]